MAFAGGGQRWEHWGGRLDLSAKTYPPIMDMTFVRFYDDVEYERLLSFLVNR